MDGLDGLDGLEAFFRNFFGGRFVFFIFGFFFLLARKFPKKTIQTSKANRFAHLGHFKSSKNPPIATILEDFPLQTLQSEGFIGFILVWAKHSDGDSCAIGCLDKPQGAAPFAKLRARHALVRAFCAPLLVGLEHFLDGWQL